MMQSIKRLTGLNGIIFLVYSLCALIIVPYFENLFAKFGGPLPWATQWVMQTYHYWWLVPVAFFSLYLLLPQQAGKATILQPVLLVINYLFVVLEILFIPIMVIIFYLPIFYRGAQI